MGFCGSQAVQIKEERDADIWGVYPWKQRTGDLFFDQVAELETIPPVFDNPETTLMYKPYSDLDLDDGFLKESSQKDLPESLFGSIEGLELSSSLASSPCLPSSPNSDSKDSDDSSSDKDKEIIKPESPSGNKRKRVQQPTSSVTFDGSQKILDKRIRNNQASKKFRQLRKGRHKALFDQLQDLENENYMLKVQMEQMQKEINKLKSVLPDNKAYDSLLE